MREFRNKQWFRRRIFSRPVFFGVLILTIFMVKGTINIYMKKLQSSRDLATVSASVFKMEERQKELDMQIAKLGTDRGVEEEIRKKYSVVKSGEEMVVLVDDKSAVPDNVEVPQGFFERSWNTIKSWFGDDSETSTTPE